MNAEPICKRTVHLQIRAALTEMIRGLERCPKNLFLTDGLSDRTFQEVKDLIVFAKT